MLWEPERPLPPPLPASGRGARGSPSAHLVGPRCGTCAGRFRGGAQRGPSGAVSTASRLLPPATERGAAAKRSPAAAVTAALLAPGPPATHRRLALILRRQRRRQRRHLLRCQVAQVVRVAIAL